MTNEIHKRMKQWLRYNECAIIKTSKSNIPRGSKRAIY